MTRIPRRTRLLDRFAELTGRSISEMEPGDIEAVRALLTPRFPPFTWVTGPVVPGVAVEASAFRNRDGDPVGLRIYRPSGAGRDVGLLLFFHGGGFALGNPANYDPLCTHLAKGLGAVVVNVEYRLSPEHPAPAAVYDAVDAVVWAADRTRHLRVGSRFAMAGDSAGGNLVAVATQILRDQSGPLPVHQALMYPTVDMGCLTHSKSMYGEGPILKRIDTDTFLHLYLGAGPAALEPTDPLVSPLRGRLEGLPPALVQTAGLDPLRDEGRWYAEGLARAGIPVVHTDYPEAPHGFASFPGVCKGVWSHRSELVREIGSHLNTID